MRKHKYQHLYQNQVKWAEHWTDDGDVFVEAMTSTCYPHPEVNGCVLFRSRFSLGKRSNTELMCVSSLSAGKVKGHLESKQ